MLWWTFQNAGQVSLQLQCTSISDRSPEYEEKMTAKSEGRKRLTGKQQMSIRDRQSGKNNFLLLTELRVHQTEGSVSFHTCPGQEGVLPPLPVNEIKGA